MENLLILVVLGIFFAVVNAITEKVQAAQQRARLEAEQERMRRLAEEMGTAPRDDAQPAAMMGPSRQVELRPPGAGGTGPRRSGGVVITTSPRRAPAPPVPAEDDEFALGGRPARPVDPDPYQLELEEESAEEMPLWGTRDAEASPTAPRSAREALRRAIEAQIAAATAAASAPPMPAEEELAEERRDQEREEERERQRTARLASWADQDAASGDDDARPARPQHAAAERVVIRRRLVDRARAGVRRPHEPRAGAPRAPSRLRRVIAANEHRSAASALVIADAILRPRWRE